MFKLSPKGNPHQTVTNAFFSNLCQKISSLNYYKDDVFNGLSEEEVNNIHFLIYYPLLEVQHYKLHHTRVLTLDLKEVSFS